MNSKLIAVFNLVVLAIAGCPQESRPFADAKSVCRDLASLKAELDKIDNPKNALPTFKSQLATCENNLQPLGEKQKLYISKHHIPCMRDALSHYKDEKLSERMISECTQGLAKNLDQLNRVLYVNYVLQPILKPSDQLDCIITKNSFGKTDNVHIEICTGSDEGTHYKTYKLPLQNGCEIERQVFRGLSEDIVEEQWCNALEDNELNKNCAEVSRKFAFRIGCNKEWTNNH